MTTAAAKALASARESLPSGRNYEAFLAALSAKDRQNVERHIAAIEAAGEDDTHAKNWKHLACTLWTLSPLAAQTVGQQAVMFFVADGKYRMQQFAIEDLRDGKINVYAPDAMDRALAGGLLRSPPKAQRDSHAYSILEHPSETLVVHRLDAANTPNPAPFFKNMLGWNRKAVRVALLTTASRAQIAATDSLCALAVAKK
jgi:hypothetical protein